MDNEKNTSAPSGTKDSFESAYIPFINRWGRITNWLGVLLSFAPALVLLVVFDIMPPGSAIFTGFIATAAAVGVNWFIEPVSYFPIVGIAGTYMAFLTGNISNLRIPAAAVSQKVAEVEPGTNKGSIIATLGMAVSVVVNIIILFFGVVAGSYVLSLLPESFMNALNYLLPALFGALFIQFALAKLQLAPIALGIAFVLNLLINAGVFSFLPGAGNPTYVATLGTVFGTIALGVALNKRMKKNSPPPAAGGTSEAVSPLEED